MTDVSLTLPARIESAVARQGTVTFVTDGDRVTLPWAQLHDEARAMAASLQARGIGVGSHVALLGPTTRDLVTAIQATWLVGGTVVVLPLPMRLGSLDEFVLQTRLRIHGADSTAVLVDGDLAAFVEQLPGDPPLIPLSDVVGHGRADDYTAPTVDPDDLAVLQF